MPSHTSIATNWNYAPTNAPLWYKKDRIRSYLFLRKVAPQNILIRKLKNHSKWTVFFLYSPTGDLIASQISTLRILKNLNRPLLVVISCPNPDHIHKEIFIHAEAIYWKSMNGYDFSAYSIGLSAIAEHSPGATVFVMNDSVFGPHGDIEHLLENTHWDLTGFSASSQYENHIQSYAFVLRNLNLTTMTYLKSIFPVRYAYDEIWPTVACFETRFAAVASRKMSVGSFLYGPVDTDPSLDQALLLCSHGHPFLKKSLVGRFSHRQDIEGVREYLSLHGETVE